MDFPPALAEAVKEGRVVLVLGAGASLAAENAAGGHPPDGKELARLIANRFLGGQFADNSLHVVAELAASETDLVAVQEFIRETLTGFEPSAGHMMLPSFRWHGLATTNYDLLVEKAYDSTKNPAQILAPFRDRVDDLLKGGDALLYLKLHGCTSRTTDLTVPLVRTPDQYVTHRQSRQRLFATLEEWCYEHPVVFVGSSLQDTSLRQVLLELSELKEARPRYYLVMPDASPAVVRLWESKTITVLNGSFHDLMNKLDVALPAGLRAVAPAAGVSHPISERFSVADAFLSDSTLSFVTNQADYVYSGLSMEQLVPTDFYRGVNKDWAAIDQNLDVRRNLVDTLLSDVVLAGEGDKPLVELHVIKAEAGAGKTICLRRVAWEAAVEFDRLCLWLRDQSRVSSEAILEIATMTRERIYLFADNAADRVSELADLIIAARRNKLPLTVFTGERLSAWNMSCGDLEPLVTDVHQLPYLSRKEIEGLVQKLAENKSLGVLAELKHEAQVDAFEKKAGRQLLVALHEATRGLPFEDILVDEYGELQPANARQLYLSVCVLNRLNIPVRAGLIARVHGIPFSEFRDKLFSPLEHVVPASYDAVLRDYLYGARHPLIAAIVFERILHDRDARYDEYSRMVSGLNLSYETDRSAFFQLMRARVLLDLFPEHQAVVELYRLAEELAPDEAFLYHQQGIYEMRRPNGNLSRAGDLLARALELAKNDRAILHSMAELELARADAAANSLEREHHRQQASRLAAPLTSDRLAARTAITRC